MNKTSEKEKEKEQEQASESWWSIIKKTLSAQVNPCIDYFTSHKLEAIVLLILFCMIIYQITFATSEYSPKFHIQSGGDGEGGAPAPAAEAPKAAEKGFTRKALGKVGSLGAGTVKGIGRGLGKVAASTGRAVSSQFSSGISEPLKAQWDKLAPFRENTGETVKSYIFTLLELAVIMLIFFPCVSLFLVIMASYYMIRPKLKFIKSL